MNYGQMEIVSTYEIIDIITAILFTMCHHRHAKIIEGHVQKAPFPLSIFPLTNQYSLNFSNASQYL